jgi:hypothetical protein
LPKFDQTKLVTKSKVLTRKRKDLTIKIIVTRSAPAKWDEYVATHPWGTIFHHSLWHDVISLTYGYKPIYHTAVDDHGNITGGLTAAPVRNWLTGSRLVGYPFSDTCDVLTNGSEVLEALITAARTSGRKAGAARLELRLFRSADLLPASDGKQEYVIHLIRLNDTPDALFKRFDKSNVQRSIKKALKGDLDIVSARSKDDLRDFYRLHLKTRKKHGVPIQPYVFFDHLWDAFYPRNMMTLLMGKSHGRCIAGLILLWLGNTGYYKFGASDPLYQITRVNQLIMWEGIKEAYRRKCAFFDMGRSSVTNEGLVKYKDRWAGENLPLLYYRHPEDAAPLVMDTDSTPHKLARRVISASPLILMRIGGRLFYKYFA